MTAHLLPVIDLARRWAAAAIALLGLACAPAAAQTATLVLLNGKVWTENPRQPEAEAVAVAGTHILAVGSSAEISKLAGPGCRTVDLRGRRVVPGFNDSHVHFLDGGSLLIGVHLENANSPQAMRERIATYARSLPRGEWIVSGNWDHKRWNPAELPTHQLIDAVTPYNPVWVWRTDGHMALANALAMKLAGVDRNTPDVPGGEIVRDGNGNPTGIFKDEATILIGKVQPPPTAERLDAAMSAALREAAQHGVTSVQNMVGSPTDHDTAMTLREFEKFARSGRLTVRIYDAAPLREFANLGNMGVQAAFGSPVLRIGNLKAFADGALGSATAWMDAPFDDRPGNSGLASTDLADDARMLSNMEAADEAGLQMSIHAIGDRANHAILDLYEKVEQHDGAGDHRFRIEHAQHLRSADIPRFAKLGVIASMQPYHAIDDGRWAEHAIGRERARTSYAWRALLDHGAILAFGSDWPVAPLDPLMGIYAAATRRTLDGEHPGGWTPEQRITVAEAVHAYTTGSAFAEYQEKVKGSLEPGKLADLAVLTEDIFNVAPPEIEHSRIYMTIFDGNIVYQQPAT